MGGDGGTYVTGRQFIRACKTDIPEEDAAKSVKERQRRRATTCAQSGFPLEEPVVMCQLGNLFNKEAIITALINKNLNTQFSHIRGLKDLKQVQFTPNPAYSRSVVAASSSSVEEKLPSQYVCPLTGQDFNGVYPFILVWTTGWLLSEKAVREMGFGTLQTEYGPFSEDDIVTVLPTEEQLVLSHHMMAARFAKTGSKKASKEEKKRKRAKANGTEENANDIGGAESKESEERCAEGVSHKVATTTHAPSVSLKSSGVLARAASESVKAQESSNVFSGLFHKSDPSKTMKADDLLMRVAGIRGTLR